VTFRPEICVKMSIFKVDVQSDHLETKCPWVKVSQGKNVTVDVSSGSKCHSGRNVGGRNVKASLWHCKNFFLYCHLSFVTSPCLFTILPLPVSSFCLSPFCLSASLLFFASPNNSLLRCLSLLFPILPLPTSSLLCPSQSLFFLPPSPCFCISVSFLFRLSLHLYTTLPLPLLNILLLPASFLLAYLCPKKCKIMCKLPKLNKFTSLGCLVLSR
jgi:hypothetical protein